MRIIVIFLVILVLFSCQNKQNSVDKFADFSTEERVKIAEKYFENGVNYRQGSEIQQLYFDSAILANPNYAQAYFEKSVWFKKTGDIIRCFEILNKAIELDPLNHLGYRAWIKLYSLRDYEGAITDIERLDSLTPNVVDYPWGENRYYLSGLAKKQMGNYSDAINDFNKCVEEDGKKGEEWVDIYTFIYRGICYYHLHKIEEAEKDFDTALRNYPNCAEAFYWKGIISLNESNKTRAIELFNLAKENFLKNYRKTDPYYEMFDELYLEEIDERIQFVKS